MTCACSPLRLILVASPLYGNQRGQLTGLTFYVCVQEHVEGYLELSAKTKIFFATAVSMWDADFYVKVDDDVHVNIGKNVDMN